MNLGEYNGRSDFPLTNLPNELLVKLFKVGVKNAETLKALKLTSRRFYKLINSAKINCIEIDRVWFRVMLELESKGIEITYYKTGSNASDRTTMVVKYWSPKSDTRLADLFQHMTINGAVVFVEDREQHQMTSALFSELLTSPVKFQQIRKMLFLTAKGNHQAHGSKDPMDLSYMNPPPGSVSQGDFSAFIQKVKPTQIVLSMVGLFHLIDDNFVSSLPRTVDSLVISEGFCPVPFINITKDSLIHLAQKNSYYVRPLARRTAITVDGLIEAIQFWKNQPPDCPYTDSSGLTTWHVTLSEYFRWVDFEKVVLAVQGRGIGECTIEVQNLHDPGHILHVIFPMDRISNERTYIRFDVLGRLWPVPPIRYYK